MKESAQIMDINLIDHIIVADNSYFSFADEGMI
jgi:DNA repair protein RadC